MKRRISKSFVFTDRLTGNKQVINCVKYTLSSESKSLINKLQAEGLF